MCSVGTVISLTGMESARKEHLMLAMFAVLALVYFTHYLADSGHCNVLVQHLLDVSTVTLGKPSHTLDIKDLGESSSSRLTGEASLELAC